MRKNVAFKRKFRFKKKSTKRMCKEFCNQIFIFFFCVKLTRIPLTPLPPSSHHRIILFLYKKIKKFINEQASLPLNENKSKNFVNKIYSRKYSIRSKWSESRYLVNFILH